MATTTNAPSKKTPTKRRPVGAPVTLVIAGGLLLTTLGIVAIQIRSGQCVKEFALGTGGAKVEFQQCPRADIAEVLEEFEENLKAQNLDPAEEARQRARALKLAEHLRDWSENSTKGGLDPATERRIQEALHELKSLSKSSMSGS